jgi:glutaredoxin 3
MPRITMYSTSWCGYCAMARRLLESKGQSWEEVDVDAEAGRRDEMIQRSGRRTVPQIWIGEQHVGGYDDLIALERAGRLDALLSGAARSGAGR